LTKIAKDYKRSTSINQIDFLERKKRYEIFLKERIKVLQDFEMDADYYLADIMDLKKTPIQKV
jgi:hypothetical protein